MAKRGRPSSADLEVVIGGFGQRPPPPDGMNAAQAAIWTAVINSEAANFFDTAALRSLLADYCRHKESADKITVVMDQFEPEWLKSAEGAKRYAGLIRMRDVETRAAAALATKLRLTNQSRYTPQAAATAARNATKGSKPWDA